MISFRQISLFLLVTGLVGRPVIAAGPRVAKVKPPSPKASAKRIPGSTSVPVEPGVSAPPPIKERVRSISGIRHLNFQLLAARQGETASVTSISAGWGPRILRTEGAFFELRGNVGLALLKRAPSILFLAPELWVVASVKLADKLRLEAGPLVQYWITTDQGLNLGGTFQFAYEVKWVTYFDRFLLTYQPVFNKTALTHFFRIGLGFSL